MKLLLCLFGFHQWVYVSKEEENKRTIIRTYILRYCLRCGKVNWDGKHIH